MLDTKVESLSESVKEYVKIQYDILRLQLTDKFASLGSTMISDLVLIFVSLIGLFFLSVSLGFYLSLVFASNTIGFLILGGIYSLLALVCVLFRKKIVKDPMKDKLINELLKDKED